MSLTEKQLIVLDELFESGGDEAAVRQKHNISYGLWQKWLSDESFSKAISDRIDSAKRQSRIILSKYVPLAAAKLVQLCNSENNETSRKAALNILSLQTGQSLNADDADQPVEPVQTIDPATASKILAALAENENP